ncbi:MAG: ADP-ribosylglycohydrolase family protein [Arachnia sp.]
MPTVAERIHGSLAAACMADALGAPTEERSIPEIQQLWGARITSFHAPPADSPYALGRQAAQFTDDSSQMLMLAEVFVRGNGEATPEAVAEMILEWSGKPEYYPHFAGPTTRKAIDRLREGVSPWDVGRAGRIMTEGSSNGGAMRVAPAGLVNPGNIEAAAQAAFLTCVPSHNTNAGVAGAAAIAGGVAAAMVDGASLVDVVRGARQAALIGESLGAEHGRVVPGPAITTRIDLAVELAIASVDFDDAVRKIALGVGTGLPAADAVPAAIGFFVAAGGDPWLTACLAASAGGDSDTVGCMAGAIAGAMRGFEAIPADEYRQVQQANDLDLLPLVQRLAAVARRLA